MLFKAIDVDADRKKTIWLKEGESLVGVFQGDVHDFKIHWIDTTTGKKKQVCQGQGCQACAQGDKAKFQFRVNFVHKGADEAFEASLYEADWFTYQRLNKVNQEFPLEKNVVKIYKGMEGTYKVDLFARIKELDPAMLDVIKAVHLIDVEDKQKQNFDDHSDIPF